MRGRWEGACQLLLRWLDSYFPLTLLSFLGIGLREGGGKQKVETFNRSARLDGEVRGWD
jgi:hypothetical protein